jgi:hypothetical protein
MQIPVTNYIIIINFIKFVKLVIFGAITLKWRSSIMEIV